MASVGLVGLGVIGRRYLDHLLRTYDRVVVFDTNEAKVADAVEKGAIGVESISGIGQESSAVVVSLPNPPAVRSALGGEDGLISHAKAGTVVIDTSTVAPVDNREMHALGRKHGVHYLDAPVSGGEPNGVGMNGAVAGNVTFMVGGDKDAYDLARPVLMSLGKYAFHLGPSGSGSAVKLISNLCSGLYVQVMAEAFALGRACGFSTESLVEVFRHTDAQCLQMTDYTIPRYIENDMSAGFAIDLQLKDHRLAAEMAHEHRVGLPFNSLAISFWEMMSAQGKGQNDTAEACRFVAEMNGLSPAGGPTAPLDDRWSE